MSTNNFIVREPLVDPKQQVIGYELFWQYTGMHGQAPSNEALIELLTCAAVYLNDEESGWLMANVLLFVETSPALLNSAALQQLPPEKTVLIFNVSRFDEASVVETLKVVRERGFGILLRQANIRTLSKEWLPFITHLEVDIGGFEVPELAKIFGALKRISSATQMVASQADNWKEYDMCAALGLNAFAGKLHLTPRDGYRPKGVNPSQALILQLLDQLRKNAEINALENLLKKDAAISYKLLRYINSAGFGMRSEVQSLRHAVTLIGYTPLYRWLSLMLATSSTDESAAILMQTAIIRGRLVELLGEGNFPKSEQQNMFVMGLFSLLDRLLGVPMEEALKHIPLPEAAMQALTSREGQLGAYLALAEACELRNGMAGTIAESLSIEPSDVNKAHMEALAWAQNFTE